jgi:eukaryotic-like serine/threonine-protein kinase
MPETTTSRIGRYEIVGLLATGGMAEIFLGKLIGPSGFERPVVVKRVLPHLARVPSFVDMFVDEARIVAGIHHPNVVQVHELAHEDAELFLVMEYLEGESVGSLTRRLASRGETLDLALAAFLVAEACAGLHAAHELKDEEGYPRDLVHRDVSPQNVFVTYAGQCKVLDFGIAKAANRSTRTEAGQVKGKFAYMSPEQCMGKPLDRRSDVFALGVLLWELTTGRRLFKRASEMLTFKAICEQRTLRPSETMEGYPAELERVCMKALSRRREDRYQNALEMRRELLGVARSLGMTEVPEEDIARLMKELFEQRIEEKQEMLRRVRGGSVPTALPAPELDEEIELPSAAEDPSTIYTASDVKTSSRSSRRGLWLALALAVTSLSGIAFWFGSRSQKPSPSAPVVAAAPAPSTVAAPLESSRPSDEITLRIETNPAGARVLVGGKDQGPTPLDLPLAKSDKALELTLTRPGFSPRSESVVPNVSQRLVLPLTPLRSGKPKSAPEIPRFR